jgi:hypothetical protein
MVVSIRIDLEICDDRLDNLVVRPVTPTKEVQLPLEYEKQLFDVAMFSAQQVNDHGPLLDPKADRYPRVASVAAFAQYSL